MRLARLHWARVYRKEQVHFFCLGAPWQVIGDVWDVAAELLERASAERQEN